MSLIKGDRFEWAVQKCAELGVSRFVPVVSARTIKKEANVDRLRIIAKEACEQAMRASLMEVAEPISFEDAITEAISANKTLVACVISDEIEHDAPAREVLANASIAAFIGPEGGFTPEEDGLLIRNGAKAVSLGPSVLRAETAAVAMASVAMIP
jgi:16S rRNA (uracil1498-N3)-methyltransferase